MITKVEIATPGTTDMVTFDIAVPNATTRYLLKDAEGLGPVKADVGTASLAQLDGADYTGSRVNTRNIVIEFDYIPGFTAGTSAFELRQALYSIATPKSAVELTFHVQGAGTRKIEGYVESIDSPMFSKETTGQLSILCPVPWFVSETVVQTLVPNTDYILEYPGDVPSGVEFVYKTPVDGDVTALRMIRTHNFDGKVTLGMYGYLNLNQQLSRDMVMTIDMRDRQKRALQWDGRNLLPILSQFNWWKLLPGSNTVRFEGFYRAPDPANDGDIPSSPTCEITYDVLYGGL